MVLQLKNSMRSASTINPLTMEITINSRNSQLALKPLHVTTNQYCTFEAVEKQIGHKGGKKYKFMMHAL